LSAARTTVRGRLARCPTSGKIRIALQTLALSLVALLLALLAVRLVSNSSGRRLDKALAAGKSPAAPEFSLPRLNGNGRLRLSSFRGQPVVLNFWASWCVPCKQEAPLLQAAARRFRSTSLVVIGVDAQDFRGDARRFMARYGLTYPVVHDSGTSTTTQYNVTGFPETWFVDRSGHLVGEHVKGPLTRQQLARNLAIALQR